ncbi:MAG TPA: hypothetical protein VME46_23235, partial [Acidimicrobiales bacterium]|nr:hypothetical protein [Acidimicrobiales bacterium]
MAEPIGETTTTELCTALASLASTGLPATEATAGRLLLNLRSVYARSVVPSDVRSRLAAFNGLLPRLIASVEDTAYRGAMQTLFALAPGTRGSTHTARRRQTAQLLGYNADHFRTRIESQLIMALANVVQDDLLTYRSRVKRASESLEPTGDTPRSGPEHLNHEEELVSRIWQHVYGLRAETIACLRLAEASGYEAQAEDHRQAALREEAALKEVIGEYVETYGERLVRHGETEFAVEALERLAGWQSCFLRRFRLL